nr:unnamed protein product [Spirometra erinaceieuropaei]
MEELLLHDQGCLRFANQRNCTSSQRRRKYPTYREDTNTRALGCSLQRHPQPSPTPPSTVCLKWRSRSTLTSRPLHETIKVAQQLSSRKAPGSDPISAEIYKHGGPQLMDYLTALFQEMCCQGEAQRETPNLRQPSRHFPVEHRLNKHPESKFGFRHHRVTPDRVFAVRQMQKCQEMGTRLYSAFDMVNHEGLWKVMQRFGCPELFTQMVCQLHDDMMVRFTDNGVVSEVFSVTSRVEKGCVLAPTLVGLMFSAILMDAHRDERPGSRIAYRTDGHLLNQKRMHFQSRVSTATVYELLFADDCVLNVYAEGDMQRRMDLFCAVCVNFGLVINLEKTVVMHQAPPNTAPPPNAPQISVNGTQLQVVDNFTYLDSTKIDDEIARRISKASQTFGRRQNTV